MKRHILTHGQPIILNGKKGSVGSAAGFAFLNGSHVGATLRRCEQMGHEKFWINQAATCICSDPSYYEREDAKYANAPELSDGDEVLIDGVVCVVEYRGDYSDMGKLTPIDEVAA